MHKFIVFILMIALSFVLQVERSHAFVDDVSLYMDLTYSGMSRKLSGSTLNKDTGLRMGFGVSGGMDLTPEIELEGGFTWYLLNGSYVASNGDTVNIGYNPIYVNLIGHLPIDYEYDEYYDEYFYYSEVYGGAGINYSFWTLDSPSETYSVSPGIGMQLFAGFRIDMLYLEAGVISSNGSDTSSGNAEYSMSDLYFRFGFINYFYNDFWY